MLSVTLLSLPEPILGTLWIQDSHPTLQHGCVLAIRRQLQGLLLMLKGKPQVAHLEVKLSQVVMTASYRRRTPSRGPHAATQSAFQENKRFRRIFRQICHGI